MSKTFLPAANFVHFIHFVHFEYFEYFVHLVHFVHRVFELFFKSAVRFSFTSKLYFAFCRTKPLTKKNDDGEIPFSICSIRGALA